MVRIIRPPLLVKNTEILGVGKWSGNSLWHNTITDFSKKFLVEKNKTQKLKKVSYLWRRTRTFFWERSRMDGNEAWTYTFWENLLCNIYFLLVKFSRISYTGLHLRSFLSDVNQIFKCSAALRHNLPLKASGSVTDFLESVTIFLERNSKLITKGTKQKLSSIANYEAAFQNLLSTNKEKSFQWENFSTILNDLCWI